LKTFGDATRFGLAYERGPLAERGGRTSPYLASEGLLQLWAGGINLCELDQDPPEPYSSDWRGALADHLFPYVEWLVGHFKAFFQEAPFPLPLHADSAADFYRKAFNHLQAAPDHEAEEVSKILFDWFQTRCLAAGTDGGFPPEVFFRGLGSEIEISWESSKVRPYQGRCGYKNVRGRCVVSRTVFHPALYGFVRSFLQELEGRHPALRNDTGLLRTIGRADSIPALLPR